MAAIPRPLGHVLFQSTALSLPLPLVAQRRTWDGCIRRSCAGCFLRLSCFRFQVWIASQPRTVIGTVLLQIRDPPGAL